MKIFLVNHIDSLTYCMPLVCCHIVCVCVVAAKVSGGKCEWLWRIIQFSSSVWQTDLSVIVVERAVLTVCRHDVLVSLQLKFLEVSHLSFVAGLGAKMKEGMVQKRAGGRRVALHCWMCCSCCQPGHWHKRLDRPDTFLKLPSKILGVFFIQWPVLSSCLSPQCLQCYSRPQSHWSQAWQLKRVSRLFITHTFSAEHSIDDSHDIRKFRHGLEYTMLHYTRIMHSTLDHGEAYTYLRKNVGERACSENILWIVLGRKALTLTWEINLWSNNERLLQTYHLVVTFDVVWYLHGAAVKLRSNKANLSFVNLTSDEVFATSRFFWRNKIWHFPNTSQKCLLLRQLSV